MSFFQKKSNQDIRDLLATKGMKQYDLAKLLGMSEFTLSRKLRDELSNDEKEQIREKIENMNRGE